VERNLERDNETRRYPSLEGSPLVRMQVGRRPATISRQDIRPSRRTPYHTRSNNLRFLRI
jgi:hypothetical protein